MEPISPTRVSRPLLMKRHAYFRKLASPKSHLRYGISATLGLVCILLLVLSANKFINGSVFKIPMIATVTDFLGLDLNANVEDTVEKVQDNVDFALDALELICKDSEFLADVEAQLELPFEDWEATYGIQPAEFRKLFNPLSLSSLTELLSHLLGEDHRAVTILRVFIGFVIGTAVFLVLLAALATYFGKTWLSILTCVLSSGFFSLTGGFVYWLFGCASMIAMAVMCFSLTREYKQYRKNILSAPSP